MNTIQVSFRLPQDVYKQFDEKIKLSGKTKQHIFVTAIEDFLKGDGEVSQGVGSGSGSIDTKDIDEVVKDYLPDIASLVALNPDFLLLVADKVKEGLLENVKNTKETEVLESKECLQEDVKNNLESKGNEVKGTATVFNELYFRSADTDPVIYDLEIMEKLKKLPSRLSQTQVETALGIPLTYLSKYKDNPEKLAKWDYFLSPMERLDKGYHNPFSEVD